MRTIVCLVHWFCSQLTENELIEAISILLEVLCGRRSDIKLKEQFRQRHPNYRRYDVDTEPPRVEPPAVPAPAASDEWLALLARRTAESGRAPRPVGRRAGSVAPPAGSRCGHCGAPAEWLYVNDGRKCTQLRCKLCARLSPVCRVRQAGAGPFWCPFCGAALFKWKHDASRTIHKCPNRQCPHYLSAFARLNAAERLLARTGAASQFKLHYQWRVYHFPVAELRPQPPRAGGPALANVRRSLDSVGLCLAYSVSLGLSARMTKQAMRDIHGIRVSHQTVVNWLNAAAPLAWNAMRRRMDGTMAELGAAADETYIKVMGVWHYTWFVVGIESRAIWGWNVAEGRDMLPAVAVVNQTLDRRLPQVAGTLVLAGDGNPAYDAAVNAINTGADGKPLPPEQRRVERRTVVGLKDEDPQSEMFRPFKEIVERLNRTYRYHTRSRSGHKDLNGAMALTTLFVAHYNFLRPHGGLEGNTPLHMPELKGIKTLQGRWIRLLSLAA